MTEAPTADHDAVASAIIRSGLTVAEAADRAGLDPAQLHRFPLDRVPLATLSRLADVAGVPLRQLLNDWRNGGPEDAGDRSVVGAYLTEFKDGLTRDQLSEALGWTLQRVEQSPGRSGRCSRGCRHAARPQRRPGHHRRPVRADESGRPPRP